MAPVSMVEAQQRMVAALEAMSPVLTGLAARFTAAGEDLALVGGPVRDAMLGRLQNDLDFTTSATPEVTERLLAGWADATWDMGRAFGTIGARKGDWQVEITTYRSESYDPTSRNPVVAFGDSLLGDLGRRDFTVNAMAIPVTGSSPGVANPSSISASDSPASLSGVATPRSADSPAR